MKSPEFPRPRHVGTFGKLSTSSMETGLHEQLLGTQAAASRARRGATLRLALSFAALSIGAALWSGPNVEDAVYRATLAWQGQPVDDFTTASVRPAAPNAASPKPGGSSYIVRRSVLEAPGVVCIITDGSSRCE